MIYFNSTALESVAPVMIEDIRVSPIAQLPITRDRPLDAGSQFIRAHEGTRSVNITFSVLEQNRDARQRYIQAITAWAITDKPAPLQLPYHGGRMLDAMCTGLPEPSTRQWWETRLNLTFTAFDPYFYDTTEKSAVCGTAFQVLGDAPPKMRIIRTLDAAASNQSYTDGTDTMTFSTIPAGALEIDLNKQTAQVDGASIMQNYALTSTFIIPKLGISTITGTGTVKWVERWHA